MNKQNNKYSQNGVVAPLQNINNRSKPKQNILFLITAFLLILGISVVSFFTWRVITINKTTEVYNTNHSLIISTSEKYTVLVQEFQKNENRLYESDFSRSIQLGKDLQSQTASTRSNLIRKSNPTITEQIGYIDPILDSIDSLINEIQDFGSYMTCVNSNEAQIQSLNEKISTTPLITDSGSTSTPEPQTEGITKVRDYLLQQSDQFTNFSTCFDTASSLDILKNNMESTKIITSYSAALRNLADKITSLLNELAKNQQDQAAILSTQIVEDQSKLYELSPEKYIFVTSQQIKTHVDEINEQIEIYNSYHNSLESK